MITSAKYVAAIAIALAVISSPSFAKKRAPQISASQAALQMTAARAAALRACNAKAEKISFFTRQAEQLSVYRTCMFNHGQME
jgi:hypothetical protein